MEPFTLALLALVIVSSMFLFFAMSIDQPKPEPPPRIPPTSEHAPPVDVIRRESARIRRAHPVLAQNVAVARLMRLDQASDHPPEIQPSS